MKKLYVIVLAAIGMVSCMNTDEVIEVNNDNAIAFADAFIQNSVRAEINNDNLDNFEVWGWMQENTVEAPVFNAMQVSHNGADWTYSPAQYWVPGFTYTFKALSSNNATHPNWEAAETTDGKLGVVTFENKNGTEDLIYAAPAAVVAPNLGETAQPVELEFNHQLAKVKFDFEYAPELVAALELSGLTVEAEEITMKVPGKATIDYSATTPAWILDTTAAQTILEFEKEGVEKLTIPAGAAYEYEITFKVNYYQGTNVIKTIDKTSKISLAIEMGKAYNFTATLTPDNLGLTTIDFETKVEGWDDAGAGFEPETTIAYVDSYEDFVNAVANGADKVILMDDLVLSSSLTRAADETPSITVNEGKELSINLNGKTLSATSTNNSGNYDMFIVKGLLNVENGTIVTEHKGQNMGWNAMTTIFDITAGGIVNLEGVTAKNLGGSDMAFVAHLNNWGEATLNVENSTLESTYIAVRAFNSGYDMNNITINNSTLKGKYCFWVQNYVEAGDSKGTDATLNLDILNGTNTFTYTGKAPILYGFANSIYYNIVNNAEELAAAVENGGAYALSADIETEGGLKIEKDTDLILDLAGHTISATDNATGSWALITNQGNLTVKDSEGNGKMTVVATNNRAWNAYSSVISNTVGGNLVVEGGLIEHLGGTDMAYGIDNLTNGKGTYAETVINGGTIKSTYRAVRMFLNGIEAQNILTVNGGVIEGANKSIWMQDPSANANTGKLTVAADAELKGDVYLFVCAGSTAWPVEVSLAEAALVGESEVITGNVPAGYAVVLENGVYKVVKSVIATAEAFRAALADANVNEIILAPGATFEGTFAVNRAVKVVSPADTKATIVGRVSVDALDQDVIFENVKFASNDTDTKADVASGVNTFREKYAIVVKKAGNLTFEGCEFVHNGVVSAINDGTGRNMLTVKSCKFNGDYYAIYARSFFNITNCEFNLVYPEPAVLAAVFTNGNSDDALYMNQLVFKNNKNVSGVDCRGVQLNKGSFAYESCYFDIQGNTGFYTLADSVQPGTTINNPTFADGSETFQ